MTRGGWGWAREAGEGGDGGRRELAGEVERVDKMWRPLKTYGWVDVGAERQKVQMRGNGEGVKGTCWAPAPGGYRLFRNQRRGYAKGMVTTCRDPFRLFRVSGLGTKV